jgi:hypothetical protein
MRLLTIFQSTGFGDLLSLYAMSCNKQQRQADTCLCHSKRVMPERRQLRPLEFAAICLGVDHKKLLPQIALFAGQFRDWHG